MRIPNWKTWPDQVFTFPTGAVFGGFLYFNAYEKLDALPWWIGVMALFGLYSWCAVLGFAMTELLRKLRSPVPRTRLRFTRPVLWLRSLLPRRRPEPGRPGSGYLMQSPTVEGLERRAWGKSLPGEPFVLLRTFDTADDGWKVFWEQLAERKAQLIEQIKTEGRDDFADDFTPLTYEQVREAAQRPGFRLGYDVATGKRSSMLWASPPCPPDWSAAGRTPKRSWLRRPEALYVAAFLACLTTAAGGAVLVHHVVHEVLGAPYGVLLVSLLGWAALASVVFELTRREIKRRMG